MMIMIMMMMMVVRIPTDVIMATWSRELSHLKMLEACW